MLNIRAKKNVEIPDGGVSLFIFEQDRDTQDVRPVQLTLGEPQSGRVALTAQKVLTDEEATRLMDDLWGAGVRPSGGEAGASGVIEAKNAHLCNLMEIIRCLLPAKTQ